ncbi:(2Fe-2S) ferredoxin domain-containing protein [Archangium minus]|uniref:(2Fe-2S) ferredoxin domain-containing protein n=1 Tax=Archangium minus TaxID=83450 RepID=A0ABY9WI33_9BACT|nr:(2Fe-2S) ferredoxin domain-containing protein [Archangium violaceum]WNG43439.1 (2Fe-2S) ferredoxin domain-containing protein [Archangium minus]
MAQPKEVQPKWEGLVFVCRKCMKRAGAKELRSTLKEELGRGVRVVSSGCLKLCPKKRVCVVVGGSERMRCFLVDPKEDVDPTVRAISDALERPS